jgi:hypothetical protein
MNRKRRIRIPWLRGPLSAVALVTLAGCSGPIASASNGPVPAIAAASELRGTWVGSYWEVGESKLRDNGTCRVQVDADETFTATCTHGSGSSAKPSTWTGTVVTHGKRVTFRSTSGPSVTLMTHGDVLYGVFEDEKGTGNLMMKLQREGGEPAGAGPSDVLKPRGEKQPKEG